MTTGALMLRKMIKNGVDVWLSEKMIQNGSRTEIPPELREVIDAACTNSVVWDIGNVADYLDRLGPSGRMTMQVADMPCVIPPHENLWVEFGLPTLTKWHLFERWPINRIGVFVQTIDYGEPVLHFGAEHQGEALGRFLIDAYLFVDRNEPMNEMPTTIQGPQLRVTTFLDEFGGWSCHIGGRAKMSTTPISDGFEEWLESCRSKDSGGDMTQLAMSLLARDFMLPVWFAISLSHCKNVHEVEHSGRYVSRQERRRAERKGETPALKFWTLDIGPMTKALAEEGNVEKNGLKKAMHICRGHTATYTEDRPLFGKYVGQFWIPAHVRGSSRVGQVVKDYRVNAPKEGAA